MKRQLFLMSCVISGHIFIYYLLLLLVNLIATTKSGLNGDIKFNVAVNIGVYVQIFFALSLIMSILMIVMGKYIVYHFEKSHPVLSQSFEISTGLILLFCLLVYPIFCFMFII